MYRLVMIAPPRGHEHHETRASAVDSAEFICGVKLRWNRERQQLEDDTGALRALVRRVGGASGPSGKALHPEVRFRSPSKARYEQAAAEAGLTMSEWIRAALEGALTGSDGRPR